MEGQQQQYDFSRPFQIAILKTAIEDKGFMPSYSQLFNPNLFESDDLKHVARKVIEFRGEYGATPTYMELRQQVDEKYQEFINELEAPMTFSRKYITDSVIDFARNAAMRDAILQSIDFYRNGEPERVIDVVKKALMVGTDAKAMGEVLNYDEDEYIKRATQDLKAIRNPIPTGMDRLDDQLGGGLGSGELGIVMAAPGVGKTVMMVNIGAAGLRAGKHVFHYTLENSALRVLNRYDRCISGMTNEQMRARPSKFAKLMTEIYQSQGGAELIVKKFPYKGATVQDLRAHIELVRNQFDVVPGLIIADYGDIMKPSQKYTEKRHESADIYGELRNLGVECDCPVWSPSQANREGAKDGTVQMVHAAESWEKMALADVVLTLSQSKDEKSANRMRVLLDKNRDNQSGVIINTRTDFDRMRLEPLDNDDPDEKDDEDKEENE